MQNKNCMKKSSSDLRDAVFLSRKMKEAELTISDDCAVQLCLPFATTT